MPLAAITDLVQRDRAGDPAALQELLPLLYDHLRRVAARYLRQERPDHTLAPTAVVHEAYLRLAGSDLEWQDRAHLLAIASGVMRRVLVDHARTRNREKRGAGAVRLSLDEVRDLPAGDGAPIMDLDSALSRLAELDERKARVIELIYFGGLTYEEAASFLGVSAITIHRELKLAKAWLSRELSSQS